MYNMQPLEEEWKRYRAKKIRPWYLATALLLLIGISVIFLYNKKNFAIPSFDFDIKSKLNIVKNKEKSTLIVNDALVSLETRTVEKVEVTPVLQKEENILVDIPVLETIEKQNVMPEVERERKRVHLDIIQTNGITAYKDVEKRFLVSHDIDDALFLAKSFYKKSNYEKSESWAYEVNKIDSNNVESIFIFVKSKVKLGKENEAISILNNYIKKTNSDEAKTLLSDIENHKL